MVKKTASPNDKQGQAQKKLSRQKDLLQERLLRAREEQQRAEERFREGEQRLQQKVARVQQLEVSLASLVQPPETQGGRKGAAAIPQQALEARAVAEATENSVRRAAASAALREQRSLSIDIEPDKPMDRLAGDELADLIKQRQQLATQQDVLEDESRVLEINAISGGEMPLVYVRAFEETRHLQPITPLSLASTLNRKEFPTLREHEEQGQHEQQESSDIHTSHKSQETQRPTEIEQINEEEETVATVTAKIIADAAASAAADAEARAEASSRKTREARDEVQQAEKALANIRLAIEQGRITGEEATQDVKNAERRAVEARRRVLEAEAMEEYAVRAAMDAEAEAEVTEGMAFARHQDDVRAEDRKADAKDVKAEQ